MKDIIIFGTGEVGKRAISYLKNKYNILFVSDNDNSKWESTFDGFTIKDPVQIQQHDCDIIIASTKYGIEIANQLQEMGVGQDNLYFCRIYQADGEYGCDIYPLDAQSVLSMEKKLVQYDLLNAEEQESNHVKVLVCCKFRSVYPKQLIENMSKRYGDIEFSLLTGEKESEKYISAEHLKHIYYFQTMSDLKTILEQLPVYDNIQLLWIENEWAYFGELIRIKAAKLNLLIGGSDFYRARKAERDFKKKLIMDADSILSVTDSVSKDFRAYYGEEIRNKIVKLHYGKEVLDFIKDIDRSCVDIIKQKFHIPLNKIVVTCGHNANKAHQHMDIIDALYALPDCVKKQIVCVFPMTYPDGSDVYINSIHNRLKETELDYVILREFMNFQAMAEYAVISDIMIHVQITDLLSSAMMEAMYAGSVVIAGSWLPYGDLHEMNIYFLDVDTISDVTNILEDIVTNIEEYKGKCKGNAELVWRSSSWDELAPHWYDLWECKSNK